MRHDKEAFAGQAMAAAHVGKLIGDDVRILVFSAYVAALDAAGGDAAAIRRLLDPFTGGFVSDIPQTLVLLRLALRTLRLTASAAPSDAAEYAVDGARRVAAEMEAHGDAAFVGAELALERRAWDTYYEAIESMEKDGAELAARAATILDGCRVRA